MRILAVTQTSEKDQRNLRENAGVKNAGVKNSQRVNNNNDNYNNNNNDNKRGRVLGSTEDYFDLSAQSLEEYHKRTKKD